MITRSGTARFAVGVSADQSKYEKVPASVKQRFALLQKLGLGLLAVLLVAWIAGDFFALTKGKKTSQQENGGNMRGVRVGSVTAPLVKVVAVADETKQQPGAAGGADVWVDSDKESSNSAPIPAPAVDGSAISVADMLKNNEVEKQDLKQQEPPASPGVPGRKDRPRTLMPPAVEGPVSWELAASSTTCEGYFGNGYDETYTLLEGPDAPLLECKRHSAVTASFCSAGSVVMHPDRIRMSRGGESLEKVMGRQEDDEVPRFDPGAFEILTAGYDRVDVKAGSSSIEGATGAGSPVSGLSTAAKLTSALDRQDKHKLEWLRSVRVIDGTGGAADVRVCASRIAEPVIFVTRMEYANLFHTSTDWYDTWSTARVLGLEPTLDYGDMLASKLTPDTVVTPFTSAPKIPAHIVFLDGHNAGPMDEGWLALFVSISYAKHFIGPTCFDNLMYAPFGYNAAISMGLQPRERDCRNDIHVRQFGNDMVRGLGIAPRAKACCGDPGAASTPILFVRRVHYLAHPRHNGKIVRRLDNEDEIVQALETQTAGGEAGVSLLNGLFSSMTMKEQVEMAQAACVMSGAHGAGLSHILFAPPGVHMLELQPPAFRRPHFVSYSYWTGAHHHNWLLDSSTPDVHQVVARVLETAQHAAVEAKAAGDGEAVPLGDHPMHIGNEH